MLDLVVKYTELLSNVSEMSRKEAESKLKVLVKNLNINGGGNLINLFDLLIEESNKKAITVINRFVVSSIRKNKY